MREQRKVVTILFCDLVGSTALGESTDPEALRARMRRYFEDLRAIIERHGGTVEKFVGDAVMAVFGIPVSHEDDALRAVRAASEMCDAISAHGLEARIGVNTGEVVVGGESETLVTGDAVNVAARLEQAAASGEVLIGADTRMLVRDAVRADALEPLALKGKSEPVEAYRLLEVISAAAPLARHLGTRLVGRERERQRLWRDYEDAVADRTCRLFTLLGPAGIGKSRLVADFLERAGDSADVLRGRCLSYGEGITYWPLVEMLIAIGVEPGAVIGTSPPETQLAFRRLLEARAAARPQVVVIDDLQWAEPVFVDLVEHIADLSRDASIFLLCVARTELLDVRPGWGGGKLNATSLLLEPLGADECAELMEEVAEGPLDASLRERITVASAGNPLYVEEMLAMVREHGDGEIVVPPTIHALLQARIDTLDGDVRVVMERGAVEGEVFHRGSVAELSPDPLRPDVGAHLATLVRKELIRSTSPTFPQDEGYRFRHLLIRDAAYESLPKSTRADLHERFADWLSAHELVERDEIVGYHLEQAYRYRAELDPGDPALGALAGRAAARFSTAADGALGRGDWAAARNLLRRGHALLPSDDPLRSEMAVELAYSLQEAGELRAASGFVAEAMASADPVIAARGIVAGADFDSDLSATARSERREEARAVLEAAVDHLGLARYWYGAGYDSWAACRSADAIERWERGARHADAAGAVGLARELERQMVAGILLGPIPVPDAIEFVLATLDQAAGSELRETWALLALGVLRAMEGRIDEARELVCRGRQTVREAGQRVTAAGFAMRSAFVERRAADFESEERVLREGMEELERLGERQFGPTVALELAACLYHQGRYDETRALCAASRARSLPDDVANMIFLDALEGALLAHDGRLEEGEAVTRRGLELSDTTDLFQMRAHARTGLAEVLALAGKREEAVTIAAECIAIHDDKGDVTGSALMRGRFEAMGIL
jgi:class 3 adenylate cyclase/tetratricopeptide (TPR) repeat protein